LCRNFLLLLNCVMYLYQAIAAINSIRVRYPSYWPNQALPITFDVLWGSSVLGPVTLDFAHSIALSRTQPHRYVTSGFLHGGILHLLLNMDALRRLPSWLETGLGKPLYLTTYLLSVVGGNLGHTIGAGSSSLRDAKQSMCVGASGGICGLYGLLYVSLLRMGNAGAASRVMKGMSILFLYGVVNADVSNAAHIGGFVSGLVLGVLCGPSYQKSYALRRKWSLEVDASPKDYRLAMGFGTKPTSSGLVPLFVVWMLGLLFAAFQPKFRAIPRLVWQGLIRPGSVYAQI